MKYAAAVANARRVPQNRGGVSLPSAQGDTVTGQDNEAGTPPTALLPPTKPSGKLWIHS